MCHHGWDRHKKKKKTEKVFASASSPEVSQSVLKMAVGFTDGCLHFEKDRGYISNTIFP